jgi:hypothetical protein
MDEDWDRQREEERRVFAQLAGRSTPEEKRALMDEGWDPVESLVLADLAGRCTPDEIRAIKEEGERFNDLEFQAMRDLRDREKRLEKEDSERVKKKTGWEPPKPPDGWYADEAIPPYPRSTLTIPRSEWDTLPELLTIEHVAALIQTTEKNVRNLVY